MNRKLRDRAIELSARFAKIGEDAGISVARADLIYDFLSGDFGPLSFPAPDVSCEAHSKSPAKSGRGSASSSRLRRPT
jgi:hypothetical protein